MSTKWYVRPILQQQNEFNELVVEAFREAETKTDQLREYLHTWETTAVEVQRSNQRLTRDLALLESRLQRIEDHLVALRRQLGDEPTAGGSPEVSGER